jgi:hypothetical protein
VGHSRAAGPFLRLFFSVSPRSVVKIAMLYSNLPTWRLAGMGEALLETYAAARRIFEEADDVLGLPLARLCFEGPATFPIALPLGAASGGASLQAISRHIGSQFGPVADRLF